MQSQSKQARPRLQQLEDTQMRFNGRPFAWVIVSRCKPIAAHQSVPNGIRLQKSRKILSLPTSYSLLKTEFAHTHEEKNDLNFSRTAFWTAAPNFSCKLTNWLLNIFIGQQKRMFLASRCRTRGANLLTADSWWWSAWVAMKWCLNSQISDFANFDIDFKCKLPSPMLTNDLRTPALDNRMFMISQQFAKSAAKKNIFKFSQFSDVRSLKKLCSMRLPIKSGRTVCLLFHADLNGDLIKVYYARFSSAYIHTISRLLRYNPQLADKSPPPLTHPLPHNHSSSANA